MATFGMLLRRSDQMVAGDTSATSASSSRSMGVVVRAGAEVGVAVGSTTAAVGSAVGGGVIVAELVSSGVAELVSSAVAVAVAVGVGAGAIWLRITRCCAMNHALTSGSIASGLPPMRKARSLFLFFAPRCWS